MRKRRESSASMPPVRARSATDSAEMMLTPASGPRSLAAPTSSDITRRRSSPDHCESAPAQGPARSGRVQDGRRTPSRRARRARSSRRRCRLRGTRARGSQASQSRRAATRESCIEVFPFTKRPVSSTRCRRRFSVTPFSPTSTASTRCTASPLIGAIEIFETRARGVAATAPCSSTLRKRPARRSA